VFKLEVGSWIVFCFLYRIYFLGLDVNILKFLKIIFLFDALTHTIVKLRF